MSDPFRRLAPLALTLAGAMAMPAWSAPPAARTRATLETSPSGAELAAPLAPRARGDLARAFVLKWGGYVQRVYGIPVNAWAKRMVPSFVSADPANFRVAMRRDTLEGALATLEGHGHRLSDAQVIDRLGRLPSPAVPAHEISMKLGDATQDLVYTPIDPCRIVDTRLSSVGYIGAGQSVNFVALASNAGNFTFQGGSSGNCGALSYANPAAVALNVTVVTPTGAGYATVYPYNTTRPLASSLNYASGAIVNNTVVTRIPSPYQAYDFAIYTYQPAQYVVDIVGYFAAPLATDLECVDTAIASNTIAANSNTFFNNPACPSGYTSATPYCYTPATGVYQQGSGHNNNNHSLNTFCAWSNATASAQTVYGGASCCRVPGR